MANHEILLYGDVGGFGTSASDFIDKLKTAGYSPVDLRINSDGGSVFDGYAIYNALKRHSPGVNVYVDGLAASIASYIAMVGTQVSMAKNAMLMIHRPSSGFGGGNAEEMRRQADVLDGIQRAICDAYSSRTGIPIDEMSKMLDEETWIDAEQALAFGFIDEITPELAMAASFDGDRIQDYKNAPDSIKNAVWTTAYINNLPDSAFLYVEDGGKKDGESKTVPRTLRHFPYKDASGKVDLPHLRNALARIPQSNLPADVKDRLTKKAQQILANETKNTMNTDQTSDAGHQASDPAAAPSATNPKPSIFSRVASMIKDKSEMAEIIAKHQGEIETRDKTILELNGKIDAFTEAIATQKLAIEDYKKGEKELNDAIESLKAKEKSVSDRAIDAIAAAGFDRAKLPASVEPPVDPDAILDQYNSITEPGEKTKFLRANMSALRKANEAFKAQKNQQSALTT